MWNKITNEKQLEDFLKYMCNFHDSCIKEIKYISGAYVDREFYMHPFNYHNSLKIIIHSQCNEIGAIEIEFLGLNRLNLNPIPIKKTCEIFEGAMKLKNNEIIWCDDKDNIDSTDNEYFGCYISSAQARWRKAKEYIGEKEIY